MLNYVYYIRGIVLTEGKHVGHRKCLHWGYRGLESALQWATGGWPYACNEICIPRGPSEPSLPRSDGTGTLKVIHRALPREESQDNGAEPSIIVFKAFI